MDDEFLNIFDDTNGEFQIEIDMEHNDNYDPLSIPPTEYTPLDLGHHEPTASSPIVMDRVIPIVQNVERPVAKNEIVMLTPFDSTDTQNYSTCMSASGKKIPARNSSYSQVTVESGKQLNAITANIDEERSESRHYTRIKRKKLSGPNKNLSHAALDSNTIDWIPTRGKDIQQCSPSDNENLNFQHHSSPPSSKASSKRRKLNPFNVKKNCHGDAADIISTLVEKRSNKRLITQEVLNDALLQGKPNPPKIYVKLNESTAEADSKTTEEMEKFNRIKGKLAENMIWITGSSRKYLCWPCLLFDYPHWSVSVDVPLDDLLQAVETHRNEESHISASIKLVFYEKTLKRNKEARLETALEKQRKTDLLLKLLVQIACSNMNATADEHTDLLNLACSYNTELKEFIKEQPTTFLRNFVTSKLIHISGSTGRFLLSEISKEIESASFVSVIFEDTSDVVDGSYLAVILRYVHSGVAAERLVKLVELGMTRSVTGLLNTMNLVVQEFQLREKLVGFSYSGTVLPPNEVLIFNKTVNRIYPKAKFFPYQEHNLKKLISQSLSHLPECRSFFHTMSELREFLKNNPKFIQVLKYVEEGKKGERQHWNFAHDFINTVKCHYTTIMSSLELFVKPIDYDSVLATQVRYMKKSLDSSHCRQMLYIVSAIFGAVTGLSTAMETKLGIDKWNILLLDATMNLEKIRKQFAKEPLQTITSETKEKIIETALLVVNHRCVDLELAFLSPQFVIAASKYDKELLDVFLQRIDVNSVDFIQLKDAVEVYLLDPLSQNLPYAIEQLLVSKTQDPGEQMLLTFLELCHTIPTKDSYSKSVPAVHRLRIYTDNNKTIKFRDLLIFMEKELLIKSETKLFNYVKDSMEELTNKCQK